MPPNAKNNGIFLLMVGVLLLLAGYAIYYNYRLLQNPKSPMARIAPEVLSRGLESGNLSLRKADFFQVVGGENQRPGTPGKILIYESSSENGDFGPEAGKPDARPLNE